MARPSSQTACIFKCVPVAGCFKRWFVVQDLEFVVANKVTHIINCAGKQIQNHWEPIGVAYLTFFWLDQDNQVSATGLP